MSTEERAHALLGASSAEKWLNCPPSARLEETFPETTSEYAEEGTLAHNICELKLRKLFIEPGMPERTFKTRLNKLKKDPLYQDEMDRYTDEYVEYIQKIAYAYPTPPYIAIEKRVDYGHVAPEGFGTSDCIILSGTECHVIDFKYGKGIPKSAEGNPQMCLYAIGVMAAYKLIYPIDRIYLHIVQPRTGNPSTWETNANELAVWGEVFVKPRAGLAFKGEGDFCQGKWCDDCFCAAGALCRHRKDENMALERYTDPITGEYPDVSLLSLAEAALVLGAAQNLAAWVKKLERHILAELLAGNEVPGWKLVEGRSNRVITDIDAAFAALTEAGYKKALFYEKVPITLTQAEQLINKDDYKNILAKWIEKPAGKPTLAPESDKRPAYQLKPTAEEDFGGDNAYKEETAC